MHQLEPAITSVIIIGYESNSNSIRFFRHNASPTWRYPWSFSCGGFPERDVGEKIERQYLIRRYQGSNLGLGKADR